MKKTLRFLFLTIFTVSLSYSQVVINEIMYNPYYELMAHQTLMIAVNG